MILLCRANIIKNCRMKEAEQMWLVAQLTICFILFGCYSSLTIPAFLRADDRAIALLCTSIISIILVFNNHLQSMSLRSRQRGNTFGVWLTHPSVSQEFIFWLFGLCCCAILEQWLYAGAGGRSWAFLYAPCWPVFLLFHVGTQSKLDPGVANLAAMLGNSCGGKSQLQWQDLSTMQKYDNRQVSGNEKSWTALLCNWEKHPGDLLHMQLLAYTLAAQEAM